MWEDPIVAEIHRAREKLAAQYDYDIAAFFADLRKRQTALGDRLVHLEKRGETTAEADEGRHSDSSGSVPSDAAPAS
jgi:hypothetical protein